MYINTITDVLTAVGTVSSVIVSLWLANRDSRPKLKVEANIGYCFDQLPNSETIPFWSLSCANISKIPIICTGLYLCARDSKCKKRKLLVSPLNTMLNTMLNSTKLPKLLQYSESATQYIVVNDELFISFKSLGYLSKNKCIARIQLKWFWSVVAQTNVKNFSGRLSNGLIDNIISFCLSRDTSKNYRNSEDSKKM